MSGSWRTAVKWCFYLALVVGTVAVYDRVRGTPTVRYQVADLRPNMTGPVNLDGDSRSLGCVRVERDDFLGGLNPLNPLGWCWRNGEAPVNVSYFKNKGCTIRSHIGLVMLKDGKAHFVSGVAELAETFAPIKSASEALSYALAATALHVSPTETFVDESPGEYNVRLYSDMEPPCGCAEHKTLAVDVLVTTHGDVREKGRQVVRQMLACID